MSSKADAVAETMRQVRDDIDSIRDRIAELREKRSEVEARPADLAAIERTVDEYIASRARLEALDYPFIADPAGFSPAALDRFISSQLSNRPEQVLAVIASKALRDALLRNAPRDGISSTERAAELARIDRDMLNAELAEELTIRQVEEATGSDLLRRVDADPAILLAPTAELQAGGRK